MVSESHHELLRAACKVVCPQDMRCVGAVCQSKWHGAYVRKRPSSRGTLMTTWRSSDERERQASVVDRRRQDADRAPVLKSLTSAVARGPTRSHTTPGRSPCSNRPPANSRTVGAGTTSRKTGARPNSSGSRTSTQQRNSHVIVHMTVPLLFTSLIRTKHHRRPGPLGS
jgi:hypothetical protein